tara:strand:+ start:61 stop:723 length:663 start_codon:yes stop_codon:yes gene_type:complete
MSFWNKNRLSNETKQQYAELLIELVELNEDKQWLEYFHNLRLGHDLPGGGMGSLNDWSPSYKNDTEYAWLNLLYRIAHKLLTEKLESEFIKNDYSVKHRNEVNILKCSNCNQKFQHPRIFEDHIATFYYFKNFSKFVEQKMLKNFTNPNFSYKNLEARNLRDSLESEYEKKGIILFDFLKNKRICPKCDTKMEIEHIDFTLVKKENKFELNKKKPVANNV